MLQETDSTIKGANNTSVERNPFEDIGSLEEADCYIDFISEIYPKNGRGKLVFYIFVL